MTSILVVPIQILSSPDIGRITSDEIVSRFTSSPESPYVFVDWYDVLERLPQDREIHQSLLSRPDCIFGTQLANLENIDLLVCGQAAIRSPSANLHVTITIIDVAVGGRPADLPSFEVETQEEAIQRIADELEGWLRANRGSGNGPLIRPVEAGAKSPLPYRK